MPESQQQKRDRDRQEDLARLRGLRPIDMDIENLDAGQEFEELPVTFTIFVTEHDIFGKGEPVYSIERANVTTYELFENEEHILYVSGEYRGESEIGKLMHDFTWEMYFRRNR